jgi:hypothetical protein
MILAGGLAAGLSAAATGQQPPDFSGTWRATKTAPDGREAAPTPVFGEVFALRHRGQTLDLIRPVRGRETAWSRVPLDGSEQRDGARPDVPRHTGSIVKAAGRDRPCHRWCRDCAGAARRATVNLNYTFRREGADRPSRIEHARCGDRRASRWPRSTNDRTRRCPSPATIGAAAARATIGTRVVIGHWVGTSAATTFEVRGPRRRVAAAMSRTMRGGDVGLESRISERLDLVHGDAQRPTAMSLHLDQWPTARAPEPQVHSFRR